jgi:hypothetical protein
MARGASRFSIGDPMPSPFPGMNPYFEQDDVWHDFHERFIPAAAAMIEEQVGPEYIVKIDEQMYIHEPWAEERRLHGRSDVSVAEVRETSPAESATIAAPAVVELPVVDVERHSFLEIRDRRSRRLITVIEVLSPSNKAPGPDREQYLAKRGRTFASSAHLVEIDLLRGHGRMPMTDAPDCDYCILVSRAAERPRAGVWPLQLRDPLPTIPIPLQPGDADVQLDLQRLLQRVYDAAGYAKYIYDESPQPPLSPEDAAWAAEQIAKDERS